MVRLTVSFKDHRPMYGGGLHTLESYPDSEVKKAYQDGLSIIDETVDAVILMHEGSNKAFLVYDSENNE